MSEWVPLVRKDCPPSLSSHYRTRKDSFGQQGQGGKRVTVSFRIKQAAFAKRVASTPLGVSKLTRAPSGQSVTRPAGRAFSKRVGPGVKFSGFERLARHLGIVVDHGRDGGIHDEGGAHRRPSSISDLMSSAVSAGWSLRRAAMARRSSRRPSAVARTSARAGLPAGTIRSTGSSCRVTITSSELGRSAMALSVSVTARREKPVDKTSWGNDRGVLGRTVDKKPVTGDEAGPRMTCEQPPQVVVARVRCAACGGGFAPYRVRDQFGKKFVDFIVRESVQPDERGATQDRGVFLEQIARHEVRDTAIQHRVEDA